MKNMIDLSIKYNALLSEIKRNAPFQPEIALILGSGLGDFAEKVNTIKSIPTSDLVDYPKSTVEGHKGFIHFAKHSDKDLLIFQGRIHFYEGYRLSDSLLPVHIAKELGCKKLILTNAAGGINPNFIPGDLMLTLSFNSISMKKELTDFLGVADITQKNNFLNLPSNYINQKIREAALEEKIILKEGTYILSKGPSYETPAEIKMYSLTGNDAVGMSTVHEAIYGAVCGMHVSAISLITNYAAGISSTKLSHTEVIETGIKSKAKFERLIKRTLSLLK